MSRAVRGSEKGPLPDLHGKDFFTFFGRTKVWIALRIARMQKYEDLRRKGGTPNVFRVFSLEPNYGTRLVTPSFRPRIYELICKKARGIIPPGRPVKTVETRADAERAKALFFLLFLMFGLDRDSLRRGLGMFIDPNFQDKDHPLSETDRTCRIPVAPEGR